MIFHRKSLFLTVILFLIKRLIKKILVENGMGGKRLAGMNGDK
jgi:hypothetical protein